MSNIVKKSQSMNPENWDVQTQEQILNYLQTKKILEMQRSFNTVNERLAVMQTDMQDKFTDIQDKFEDIRKDVVDIGNKQFFIDKTKTVEYLTLTAIGRLYNPTLNIKQMVKLLKILKIIHLYAQPPEPLSIYMQNSKEPLAIKKKSEDIYGEEHFNYHFHSSRLWKLITTKLDKIGKLNKFLSLKDKNEIWKFIDNLPNNEE